MLQPFNRITTRRVQWVTDILTKHQNSDEEKRKILILEDDKDLLYLFQEVFKINGFEVDAFSNHRAAISSFGSATENYDLILMDLKLDGVVDGRTVYKKFKEPDPKLKICVFTGLEVSVNEFKEICPSFEERYLIQKPVSINSLVQKINAILQ